MLLRRSKSIFILLAILLAGCNKQTVYHSYLTFDKNGWEKGAKLPFQPDSLDIGMPCRIYIEIRNNLQYRYQDLWLVISDNLENAKQFESDTLHYILTDSTGYFSGNGIGNSYESSFYYKDKIVRNPHPTFRIRHIMKDENLQGITDIGLKIERSGQHQAAGK